MNLSEAKLPDFFSGIVRLFPLPNLVLFPGVVQALHIFEPRYRKMMQDLMASDQLVTLCLYQDPEASFDAESVPAIHQTVCIAKVIAQKELEDGRFNLLVLGVKRARIVRELAIEQPYRMAEVDVIEDEFPQDEAAKSSLRQKLLDHCETMDLFSKLSHQLDLKKVVESHIETSLLVDLICFSADLDCSQRQSVLELANVEERIQTLLEFLQMDFGNQSNFPPDFSNN